MNMTEKLMAEGGTIITYNGGGTSLTSFRCTPVSKVYFGGKGGRSATAPRTISPETVDSMVGNIFVDALHVPKTAYGVSFGSAGAAIGSLKNKANPNPATNYVQLVKENIGTQATGTVTAYHFEPIE